MKKHVVRLKTTFWFLILISFNAVSQKDSLRNLNEVVVNATRASEKTATTFTNVFQKQIEKMNFGQDVPFLLNQLPSVVVTSDAGTGIGYTGIRIRGTDPTRINVTLNGIPYNDSESQGVYWVDMPDFASSIQSIQVQRGVGTSTNGAGAFGGSINVNTLQLHREPMAEINTSYGSFNSLKSNIIVSSGLINNHFVFDARLSKITSDGFVDRSASDLRSFYVSSGYYNKNSFVRFNVFSGHENTYQSWYGIPQALAMGDKTGLNAFGDRNGYDANFINNMWARGRKFNFYDYSNQVDDYIQTHFQLISSLKLSKNWRFSPTLFLSKGKGFYEEFKNKQKFEDYGLNPVYIGKDTLKATNLVRRQWLDNNFYGTVWSLDYEGDGKLKGNFGGGINRYDGAHFGEIIWAQNASNSQIGQRYYDNMSHKTDFNIYGRAFYDFSEKLSGYLDLQYRNVGFKMNGIGDGLQTLNYSNSYNFFNPKLGFTYLIWSKSNIYFSYAAGNKEPSRQDFVDNVPTIPKAEHLDDFEAGFRTATPNWKYEANLYFMNYKNQLVLTGQINSVGSAIRTNAEQSYRAGLELQASGRVSPKLLLAGNVTFSQNKIANFNEVIPGYSYEPDIVNKLSKSDISFSPNIIAGGSITYLPFINAEISLLPKYVGKQYLDNTMSEARKLDGFFLNNLRVSYSIHGKSIKEINISLLVNNLFSVKYQPNGYTYSYASGGERVAENFVYPQAGISFLSALRLRF